MLCPFLTRVASKAWKMSVCHGLHPTEQDPGKFEARYFPENLGTTMVCEEIKDHHMQLPLLHETSTPLLAMVLLNAYLSPVTLFYHVPAAHGLWFFWDKGCSTRQQHPVVSLGKRVRAPGAEIRSWATVKVWGGLYGGLLRAAHVLRALTLSPPVSRTTCAWDSLSFFPFCITTCFYLSFHLSVPHRRHLDPGAAGSPLQHGPQRKPFQFRHTSHSLHRARQLLWFHFPPTHWLEATGTGLKNLTAAKRAEVAVFLHANALQ